MVRKLDLGFEVETVTSGFLGHEIIYFLWQSGSVIATSLNGKDWKMGIWFKPDFKSGTSGQSREARKRGVLARIAEQKDFH